MLNEYMVEARLAEIRQAAMRAGIERAVRELYSNTRHRPIPVDPALYARYFWYGFHS